MGAPARDYFCENGHHVDSFGHHEIGDELEVCPYCGSTNIKAVFEWFDPDYWEDGNIDAEVPHKPIGSTVWNSKKKCAVLLETNEVVAGMQVVDVDIYDVSNLFRGNDEDEEVLG